MVLSHNIKSPDKLGNYSKRYPILIIFVFGLNLILTGCAREKAVYRPGINNELEKKVVATSGQKVNAVQAEKYLKKVVEEHPNTPWADLASRELSAPFGFKWVEYTLPPPPRAMPATNAARRPQTKSQPTAAPPKL